jgi:hypothetical protein
VNQGCFDWDAAPEPDDDGPEDVGNGRPSLEDRFEEWIQGHGATVYSNFVEIADEIRNAGRSRFGGKAIAEIARFRRVIEGRDAEGFKVNNSFVALMVRRLMAERPEYTDWFETRRLRSDRATQVDDIEYDGHF